MLRLMNGLQIDIRLKPKVTFFWDVTSVMYQKTEVLSYTAAKTSKILQVFDF